ncbi:class I SAM-dependent methyltransferase [Brevibacterium linens]|uniref:class I SAM-dependent methyltransferase n=1 Tax=Brevibacterium linens TaxID=1703 RepID=UPI003BF46A6F
MFGNSTHVHHRRSAPRTPFVPALGLAAITPLYSVISGLTRPTLRRFLRRTGIEDGMAVLDVGCGTGEFAVLIAQTRPGASPVGLDPDPAVLDVARARFVRAGVDVDLRQGTIESVVFEPGSFDRIVSTFVLHHLSTDEKSSMLAASLRLLRPGGQLHVTDVGAPHNTFMKILGYPLRALGGDRVEANTSGSIPTLIQAAGFTDVEQLSTTSSLLGTIGHWSATRTDQIVTGESQ